MLLIAIAAYISVLLLTHLLTDPGWNNPNSISKNSGFGGVIGTYIVSLGIYGFGYFVFMIPVCIVMYGWNYQTKWKDMRFSEIYQPLFFFVGIVLIFIGGCGLENLYGYYQASYQHGGVLGSTVTEFISLYIDDPQITSMYLVFLLLLGTSAIGLIPWFKVLEQTGGVAQYCFSSLLTALRPEKTDTKLKFMEIFETLTQNIQWSKVGQLTRKIYPLAQMTKKKKKTVSDATKKKKRKSKEIQNYRDQRNDPVIVPLNID